MKSNISNIISYKKYNSTMIYAIRSKIQNEDEEK